MEECCGKKDNCEGDYCEMSSQMVCLADKAWSELMSEKLKREWEKHRGETMDKVAEVVIQHSMAIWEHRMKSQDMEAQLPKEEVDKFKEELGKTFME